MGRFRAMASPCEVLAQTSNESHARALCEAVADCAWRVEDKFSRYRDDNIVARINGANGEPVEVDEETANLLDFAQIMHRLSEGAFDITSGVLRRVWRFDGGSRSPTRAELDPLLQLVGWQRAQWSRPTLTMLPGMQIDFGGIGKEYAVDLAAAIASRELSDPVLVNFGGDLAVTRARQGDLPWRVGIEASTGSHNASRLVDLSAGALATSGDTYRFVQSGGHRLPHLLDPRSGCPVSGAPRSVTVAAASCTHAGMLSTLAMLRGAGAESFLQAEKVRHWIQR